MRHQFNRDGSTKVKCDNCGDSDGTFDNRTGQYRCGECGQYAEPKSNYCDKHEVDYGSITGYDHCPRCRQEENIRAQRRHQMTRDPRVEPW